MIIRPLFNIAFFLSSVVCLAQPNCEIYKSKNDTVCYKACLIATDSNDFSQGSAASQKQFDKALALCPDFEFACYEKAVPYLKRGDFITWEKAIDKDVAQNPRAYLGLRAWCSYKFIRDYAGAIKDIQRLTSIAPYDIGNSGDGDYHLNVLMALCYKGIGEKAKAIDLIEKQLSDKHYNPLPYDYFHLGVLQLETQNYTAAIKAFKKELDINDYLADTYYYLALAYKKTGNREDYEKNLLKAKEFYFAGKKLTDPYIDPMDKVYLADIEHEIKAGW